MSGKVKAIYGVESTPDECVDCVSRKAIFQILSDGGYYLRTETVYENVDEPVIYEMKLSHQAMDLVFSAITELNNNPEKYKIEYVDTQRQDSKTNGQEKP